MKKFLRKLVIKLHWATKGWVVPNRVYILIRKGKYNEAERILRDARKVYRKDPEILRLLTQISFHRCPKG